MIRTYKKQRLAKEEKTFIEQLFEVPNSSLDGC